MLARSPEIIWRPQAGPQHALVDCSVPEVFMGGARGGGKTDGVLGKWALKERMFGAAFNAIMFRRTTVSAEDAIERSREIFGALGGKLNESKLRWRMPNGGRVSFAYLETVQDAREYQGRNVSDAWVEEAGQYPSPAPIDHLFGVLRSAHGVPIQLILTGNPGGAGQHWIRERYNLFPFPKKPKLYTRLLPNGKTHHYAVIPSRIENNRILLERDPAYADRLQMVGSRELVRAWVEGDWSAVPGAFFDCWDEAKHVIAPFDIPDDWLRFRSGDWGSASPFSIGWWAVVGDDFHISGPEHGAGRLAQDAAAHASRLERGQDSESSAGQLSRREVLPILANGPAAKSRVIPRGALVRYREWYGAKVTDQQVRAGLKLTAEQVAHGIIEREKDDPKLSYGVLDPSAFKEDGGPSIGERINSALAGKNMIGFRGADNTRVPRAGAMGGWDQMRQRLIGNDGVPMMYFFSTCRDSIRTIPTMQHDLARAEDIDTQSEDHVVDEIRYATSSRPWVKVIPKPEVPDDVSGYYTGREELDRASLSIHSL